MEYLVAISRDLCFSVELTKKFCDVSATAPGQKQSALYQRVLVSRS
jgi:hypothetical protein